MFYHYGYNFEAGTHLFPVTVLECVLLISFLLFPIFWIIQLVYCILKRIKLRFFLVGTLIFIAAFFVPRQLPTRSFMDGLHDRVTTDFTEEELLQIRDKIIALNKKGYPLSGDFLTPEYTREDEFERYGDLFTSFPKLLALGKHMYTPFPVITIEDDSVHLRWYGSMGNPRGIEILTKDKELESDDFTSYRKVYTYVWIFRWWS